MDADRTEVDLLKGRELDAAVEHYVFKDTSGHVRDFSSEMEPMLDVFHEVKKTAYSIRAELFRNEFTVTVGNWDSTADSLKVAFCRAAVKYAMGDVGLPALEDIQSLGLKLREDEPESQSPSFTAQEISTLLSALRIASDETTNPEREAEYNKLIRKMEAK